MKKIISSILILTLLISSCMFSFAEESNGIYVIEDNEYVRIVKEITPEGTYYLSYDKATQDLTYSTSIDFKKGEVVIDFSEVQKLVQEENYKNLLSESQQSDLHAISQSQLYSPMAFGKSVIMVENTWSNFEYTKYSDATWNLRRPKGGLFDGTWSITMNETDDNIFQLQRYQGFVEDLNILEAAYISANGLNAFTWCVGVIISAGSGGY